MKRSRKSQSALSSYHLLKVLCIDLWCLICVPKRTANNIKKQQKKKAKCEKTAQKTKQKNVTNSIKKDQKT
jgi:hypothetical protein